MKQIVTSRYPVENFKFEELPKSMVIQIGMNAYSGHVFVKVNKQKLSSKVALDVMREIVAHCDVLEHEGNEDSLAGLLEMADCLGWEKAKEILEKEERKQQFKVIPGEVIEKRIAI